MVKYIGPKSQMSATEESHGSSIGGGFSQGAPHLHASRFGWLLVGVSVVQLILFVALGVALGWSWSWQSALILFVFALALSILVNRRPVQYGSNVSQNVLVWQKRSQRIAWWGFLMLVCAAAIAAPSIFSGGAGIGWGGLVITAVGWVIVIPQLIFAIKLCRE